MKDGEEITPGGTKKTKTLTQIEKQADSGRRLVEYFVVVSSVERHDDEDDEKKSGEFSGWNTESYDDEKDEFAEYKFRPTITARYPLTDHHDNPLHENVTLFCHPSGGIKLKTESFMPKVSTGTEKGRKILGGYESHRKSLHRYRFTTLSLPVAPDVKCTELVCRSGSHSNYK